MNYDIICFSHLRWRFVYQRPQHLMNRLAANHRVFFIEEPVMDPERLECYSEIYHDPIAGVNVITPHLPAGSSEQNIITHQQGLLKNLIRDYDIQKQISWYYSPMALTFSEFLDPVYTVYDCMDELSAFLFAPPALKRYEQDLIKRSDIMFTGGNSLFIAKRHLHPNIYSFPSSIEKSHFHQARTQLTAPEDQRNLAGPRLGFYGVIDERLDIGLLDQLSLLRPGWQFILIGPVVKIDPASLPHRENIHYLGPKDYSELPSYLSGWDIAMMPFALNESTRFISPTKTPEYLAGGKPVIAPSIADVVSPYGELDLVRIADTADSFVDAAEDILRHGPGPGWQNKVDNFLAGRSWERTVGEMETLIEKGISKNAFPRLQQKKIYV